MNALKLQWVLLAFILIAVYAAPAQEYSWSNLRDPVFESERTPILSTPDNRIVVWREQRGVWCSTDGVNFPALLTNEEFDRVYDDTRALCITADVLVVAGVSRTERSTSIALVRPSTKTIRWLPDSLTKLVDPRSIRNSSIITSLTDSIAVVDQLLTTDAGETWMFVQAPTPAISIVRYSPKHGVIGYARKDDSWYRLDSDHQWVSFDIGVTIMDLAYTKAGASLGIQEQFDIRSVLFSRNSDEEDWTRLDSIVVNDTFTLHIPSTVYGFASMAVGMSDAVVLALDSGVVLVLDQRGINLYSINEARNLNASLSRYDHVVNGEQAFVMYDEKGYLLNITTGEYVEVAENYGVAKGFKAIANETVFIHARSESGFGFVFDKPSKQWRISMKLLNEDGAIYQPIPVVALYSNDSSVQMNFTNGVIATSTDTKVWVLDSTWMSATNLKQTFAELLAGYRKLNTFANGSIVRTGLRVMVNKSSILNPLPYDTLSFIGTAGNGQLYSAYRDVYRFNQADSTWKTIPRWTSIAPTTVVSSVVSGKGALVASLRGYTRSYGGEVLWQTEGGFWRTTDSGISWNNIPSPSDGQWIEYITELQDGTLLAWTRNVEVVGDTVAGAQQAIYDDDSWLVRSTDAGATWDVVHSLDTRRIPSMYGCWRIIETPYGLFGCNTGNVIVRSLDKGSTWTEFGTVYTDALVISDILYRDKSLYVAHTSGVTVLPLEPVSVPDRPVSKVLPALSATPNPFSDVLRVHIASHTSSSNNAACVVTSMLGETVARIPLDASLEPAAASGEFVIPTSQWNAGIYVLSFENGGSKAVQLVKLR